MARYLCTKWKNLDANVCIPVITKEMIPISASAVFTPLMEIYKLDTINKRGMDQLMDLNDVTLEDLDAIEPLRVRNENFNLTNQRDEEAYKEAIERMQTLHNVTHPVAALQVIGATCYMICQQADKYWPQRTRDITIEQM